MGTGVHLHADAQFVTADDTARRMHQIHMAGITFWIERPLHDERTLVMALHEPRAATFTGGRCVPFC
jgi:hypothetical protein